MANHSNPGAQSATKTFMRAAMNTAKTKAKKISEKVKSKRVKRRADRRAKKTAQQSAQQPAQEPAKQPSKQLVRQLAQQLARKPARQPPQQSARQPTPDDLEPAPEEEKLQNAHEVVEWLKKQTMPDLVKPSQGQKDDYLYHTGSYERKINTTDANCQLWFNRGLFWTYAHNFNEAIRCFEIARCHDHQSIMPAWGIAYCLGTSWAKGAGIEKYHGIHTRSATALPGAKQDDAESALADAVKKLLPNPGTMLEDDRDGRSRKEAFKEAIRTAYFKFSNDTDILTIYVDAVLNLGSWDKWCVNEYDGATPGQVMDMLHIMANHIEEDKSCLRHPGFLCTLVNLAQTLSCPEMAERYAERLGELAGDAGFLHHTISRFQICCGQYGKALKTSENSVTASFKYVIRAGLYDPYTVYLLHEYCNRIKIGIDQGELEAAMDAVKDIEDLLKRNIPLTQLPPLGFHMECLLSLRAQVLLRFGCWKRILCLEIPTDEDMYSMTTVITHFAKAIAYSALNDQSNARKHQGLLSEARDKVNSKSPMLNMSFEPFLNFVEKRLDGELLYREAELEEAELVLREAMELEFSAEGWVLPTSLTLGALYLAQKNWTEAMMLFSAHVGLRRVAIEVFPIQHNEPALCSQHLNDCWAYNGLWDALNGLLRGVNTPSKVYVKNIKKQVKDAAKSKLRHVSKMTDSTFSPRNIEDWDGEPRIATF